MATFELESRGLMIKGDNCPAVHSVTMLASVLRDVLVDLPFVRIRMAVRAPGRLKNKIRTREAVIGLYLLMAGHAGYGQMGARQRVIGFLVIFDIESGPGKTSDIMTFVAFSLRFSRRKLAVMEVVVAIRAFRIVQAIKRPPRLVAFFAGYGDVFPEQGKSRVRMIESRFVDDIPSGGGMAFPAIPVESALMIDLVTIKTFRMLDFREFQIVRIIRCPVICYRRMASCTEGFIVTAGKPEGSLVMVEARRTLPGIERVALPAFGTELSAVLIGVAARAGFRKPQECPVQILARRPQPLFIDNVLLRVTSTAVQGFVFPLQFVSGFQMIEIPNSLGPPDQFRGPAKVIDMAVGAILETLAGMQSPLFPDPFCEHGMALEALARADLLTGLVAFFAVLQTFQKGMGFVQVAGRKLGRRC